MCSGGGGPGDAAHGPVINYSNMSLSWPSWILGRLGGRFSYFAQVFYIVHRHPFFPNGSVTNKSACIVGDRGSIPGLGRSPGEGHGNPLQYSCLENSTDRGAWWAIIHRVVKSQTWLSMQAWLDFIFPGGSDGKECACNAGDLGWEDPLENGMAAHFSILG